MSSPTIPVDRVDARRIGVLADSHCHPDVPGPVIEALADCDLIVPLGDTGEAPALDALARVAPVLGTLGQDDARGDARLAGARVIEAGGLAIGAVFDLSQPDGTIEVGEGLALPDPLDAALEARFGRAVDVVLFAATHRPVVAHGRGVLFVNPGSPTYPSDGPPTLAILEVGDGTAAVRLVTL